MKSVWHLIKIIFLLIELKNPSAVSYIWIPFHKTVSLIYIKSVLIVT